MRRGRRKYRRNYRELGETDWESSYFDGLGADEGSSESFFTPFRLVMFLGLAGVVAAVVILRPKDGEEGYQI